MELWKFFFFFFFLVFCLFFCLFLFLFTTRPKISAFPIRRGELPVGSGKFTKKGVISVGFDSRGSRFEAG